MAFLSVCYTVFDIACRFNLPSVPHFLHTGLPMPSVYLLPSGKYRAQVYSGGVRDSRVFRTRREAVAWANAREFEIVDSASKPPADLHTLAQTLEKYAEEVSPAKRGARWEQIRIRAMMRMFPAMRLSAVSDATIRDFRDRRLAEVSPGSVLREMGILSAVFNHAMREWRWINSNPVNDVSKPSSPEHRSRTLTRHEIHKMLYAMGYSPFGRVSSVSHSCAVLFLVALRTGARAGELCALRWSDLSDNEMRVSGKTQAARRSIPVTRKTDRLLERMRGFDPEMVFGVKPQTLDAMFRKYRSRAGLSGFTFHDTRHTAATWLVSRSRLNPFELCKIMGWSDPKMAMIYFNPTAKDLLKKM